MSNKIISCGALLYAFDVNGRIGVILGKEHKYYFPLKGRQELNETLCETAIREVREESCGLVKLEDIDLECKIMNMNRKQYHIGLANVDINIVDMFIDRRKHEVKKEFMEMTELKFFILDNMNNINNNANIHPITKRVIRFYYKKLRYYEYVKASDDVRLKLMKPIGESHCYKDVFNNSYTSTNLVASVV